MFAAKQLYTKLCCGLEKEERTRFRKQKEKKEKKLILAKSGLVGMKGDLKTYNKSVK